MLTRRPRPHARRSATKAEPLEPRRLLAAVAWDGGGDGTSWFDPLNWSANQLPGAPDDVTINVAANPTIVLVGGAASIRSLTNAQVLRIGSGATLSIAAASQSPGSIELLAGGTLTGAGDLTVTGSMRWSGGAMSGSGRTTVAAGGGSIVIDGLLHELSRRLDLNGTATWNAGEIVVDNATITNAGTFTANATVPAPGGAPALIIRGPTTGQGFFVNASSGTITKAGPLEMHTNGVIVADSVGKGDGEGGPDGLPLPLVVSNHGSIDVQAGRLTFVSQGDHFGRFDVSAGAELVTWLSNRLLSADALRGDGVVRVRSGTLDFFQSADFDGTIELDRFARLALSGELTQIGRLVFLPVASPVGFVDVRQSSQRVVRLGGLEAPGGMTFDLKDNNLIIDYGGASPLARVRQWLTEVYHGSNLTGGLPPGTALGYAEAADVFTNFPATFAGQSVDNTAVLVRHTLLGDADLDRKVNLNDFNRLAAHFGQTNRGWSQGNFNYDAGVNLNDFNQLAGNFGRDYVANFTDAGEGTNERLAELA